jgi:hypothetical protein
MIYVPHGDLSAIPAPDAAKIKSVSESRVEAALKDGVLNGERGAVAWDESFESWMPRIEEVDLSYRINLARPYTKTIRIGVSALQLAREAAATARQQAAGWDIVPVTKENLDMVLSQQRGSIDGNVYTGHLVSDVKKALRMGRKVYQKRIHTGMQAYTQGLHPAPPVVPAHSFASSKGGKSALGVAINEGAVDAFRYYDAVLVVDNERFRSWRKVSANHNLFSKGLLRA